MQEPSARWDLPPHGIPYHPSQQTDDLRGRAGAALFNFFVINTPAEAFGQFQSLEKP